MSPDLSRRIGAILCVHPVTPNERALVIKEADGVETFDDLPADVRRLLEEIESRRYGDGIPGVQRDRS